ncbi:hypothetical protein H100_04519 [Trichophyton rubrum MR850]|nr:hypothetical protein H100_04519 [Trichophyton rubrum MR850]EZF62956.1 hypothetical protein H104_04502 [Trichophyton rubrum CBS 289.86]EZF84295.1 hypothetical protein H110_04505 [Trichophyton rubrum MR1448]
MARVGRVGFLGTAIVFHVVYIYSIFDIYFVSPIVHGMRAYRVDIPEPPARRLVLYVMDSEPTRRSNSFPTLQDRQMILLRRTLSPWPLSTLESLNTALLASHTRVPTESRPGHVALITGLYEDVVAVTTGWKLNNSIPSTSTVSSIEATIPGVGGVQISCLCSLPVLNQAKSKTRCIRLSLKIIKLFEDASTDKDLNTKLRQDRIVFFLHSLGLDTTGYAHRPYSQEYLRNIQIVDQGVQEITDIINRLYVDDKTAFIFTADHGMSDWGSHGDGHPDNTRTPLIVWGSGVAKPRTAKSGKAPGHEDGFSSDWQLDHIYRHDVAQADIASLMAYLAGLEFPVNSVGELLLSFLGATDEQKAKALLVNAREIWEMYRIKEREKMAEVLHYKPYPGFAETRIENRLASIEGLIQEQDYTAAIQQSDDTLRLLCKSDWLLLQFLSRGRIGYTGFERCFRVLHNLTSLVLPFAHVLHPQKHHLPRQMINFLALEPLFIILTISYEGLFYFAISITLFNGITSGTLISKTGLEGEISMPLAAKQREKAAAQGNYRRLVLSDVRFCLFFLFLLQSAFFSTGNIASVSSFSLDAVYRLIPIFEPISQAALLIVKILAPVVLVSTNLGFLTKRLKLQGGSLFTVVMGIGDYMTLRFFWAVRDEGS